MYAGQRPETVFFLSISVSAIANLTDQKCRSPTDKSSKPALVTCTLHVVGTRQRQGPRSLCNLQDLVLASTARGYPPCCGRRCACCAEDPQGRGDCELGRERGSGGCPTHGCVTPCLSSPQIWSQVLLRNLGSWEQFGTLAPPGIRDVRTPTRTCPVGRPAMLVY